MIKADISRRSFGLVLAFLTTLSGYGQPPQRTVERIRVRLIGLADRWSDYGSRGDTPSFRDFLGVRLNSKSRTGTPTEFVKLRFLYWPQDHADPGDLAKGTSKEEDFDATRDPSCDETFSSLSVGGQISFLDPQLRPSRFVLLPNAPTRRPLRQFVLPCYEVR